MHASLARRNEGVRSTPPLPPVVPSLGPSSSIHWGGGRGEKEGTSGDGEWGGQKPPPTCPGRYGQIWLECYSNIRRTTRTFTKSHQYCLRIPCLPIPALGFMNKAKVSWTLIITVMSSTLYQLSYSLYYTDKGFAPLWFDHESNMLLLHQPA